MRKWVYLVLCTSVLGLVASCGDPTSSPASQPSSVTESTSASVVPAKTLEEMLADLSSRKITYRSDDQFYTYPIGKESEKTIITHREIEAKFDEAAYEMAAYEFSGGEKHLLTHFRYEKADNGEVSEKYVDLQNRVRSAPVQDGNGDTFQWEDSVYVNQIAKLQASKFTETGTNQYTYAADELTNIPLSIVHGAIAITKFDIETFTIEVKDNKIDKFVFVEKEADDVFPESMYGRVISMQVEEVGTTSVAHTMANRVSPDNDALGAALTEMQTAENYTTTLKLIVGEEEETIQTIKLTSTDFVITPGPNYGTLDSGVHTDGESLYVFKEKNDQLVGKLSGESSMFKNLLPEFDFSKDIFKFTGEVDGTRTYEVGLNFIEVLNDIDLGLYSEDYAQTEGNIAFKVKDNHLTEVRFPTAYPLETGEMTLAYYSIQYLDVNTTAIDPAYWNNFIVKVTVLGEPLSWEAEELEFEMVIDEDGNKELFVPALVFDLTLEDSSIIPELIPSGTDYIVSGEYSKENDCVYLDILAEDAYTVDVCKEIDTALIEAGFTADASEYDEFGIMGYTKGDVSIGVMEYEDYLVVSFILPSGELAY